MFGYVIPDKDNMYIKDFTVFQGFYCGLCKALGKSGSPITRFCTNYDTTFYNALLHSLSDTMVGVRKEWCFITGKKKPVVDADELTMKVADLSVLLVYYNVEDDIQDGKKYRAPIKWRLYLRKRKAAKHLPQIDKLMKQRFSDLAKFEKEQCKSIDQVADCFASLMRDITRELIKTDDNIDIFTYNLGRLVYLFDAVDDIEKDTKDKRYNPILLNFGQCLDKTAYLADNQDELSFLLRSTYNRIVESYNKMKIVLCEGVLSNTIYLGMLKQMERLLKGETKCQLTRL